VDRATGKQGIAAGNLQLVVAVNIISTVRIACGVATDFDFNSGGGNRKAGIRAIQPGRQNGGNVSPARWHVGGTQRKRNVRPVFSRTRLT
jgi:hypothetical protein